MNKKICIVVDHPDRDLNGYIYLITKLNLAEVTYYLVPYYNFRDIHNQTRYINIKSFKMDLF